MYKVFITDNINPWYNLSVENWLLYNKELINDDVLFLWRNRPSIIIGRFQNPWLECRLKEMQLDNIAFVRRQSGGGAVYHDEGNSNFTFISGKDGFSRTEKTNLIIKTLSSLGIHAIQGERYDIYVEGKKVSGSASKYTKGKVIHHGTLLINADLNALNNYLTTKHYKNGSIDSKGIKSVRSQVTNLSEIQSSVNHDSFCKALIKEIEKNDPGNIEIITITEADLKSNTDIKEYYNKINTWNWLYGNTPGFNITLPIYIKEKEIKCSFSIKKGIIIEISPSVELQTNICEIREKYISKRCNFLFI